MIMAMHTITAKNIGALAGHDYPGTWRISETLRALITRLEARLAYWLRYQQTVAELNALSDHGLDDVGIMRHEIRAAARIAAQQPGA
jgi:uncharacterized protein YjiS (DUF1127 family)